ncbi:ribonuclease III [Actinomadura sp. WMMA1423]|uniref:ribonuclease III n=1 Tax=Actinomadura sp. WMMA1423 TaxID=2591108 RepID=UPI00143CF18A|nr:ribonuclease III [Actinomadura sp. WMMA1423]
MTVEESARRDGSAPGREELAGVFGVAHDDPLFEQALTHRSFAYENGGLSADQRLVFVGEAALRMSITDLVFHRHPEDAEGPLSRLRAAAVAVPALAGVARSLGVGPHIRLGRGEQAGGGMDKDSILADTLTALIGVVHLQRGMDGVSALVRPLFGELVGRLALLGEGLDWKSALQALATRKGLGEPEYRLHRSGPEHKAYFTVWVLVGGVEYGPGHGSKAKEAEKQAAEAAWHALNE